VSSQSPFEITQYAGCPVALRRFQGPHAREFFLSCQPYGIAAGAEKQAVSVYLALKAFLASEGLRYESVVNETVFLRDRRDIVPIRSARARALPDSEGSLHRPARAEIGQAPLNGAALEVLIHAVVPNDPPLQRASFTATTNCTCGECAASQGLSVRAGEATQFHASGLYGVGENAYEQTLGMFEVAEALLQKAGMDFSDVMRTWIYFPEMERDYAGFNLARREFFESRGIEPIPASTGIGAGLVSDQHDLCLGLYAIKASPPIERIVMSTPTLNEAPKYGSDFSRGMRVEEANRVALHISGTASLDETGETVHLDDFEAQADRMLMNVARLLEGQGADFGDVVSAITYVKRPEDAQRMRQKFHEAGYVGFPNVLVEAAVCRPELLCETEAFALLPRAAQTRPDVD